MSGFYRFPAMAKLGELTNEQQASKMLDECAEAEKALFVYETVALDEIETGHVDCISDSSVARTAYGMELMDVIHAAETALRMEFSDVEVDELRAEVEDKNRKRGYYRL